MFTRRRDRELAAQRIAAVQELTALVQQTITEKSPAWVCASCDMTMGHRPGCPDKDVPFPASTGPDAQDARAGAGGDEDDEPATPAIMAYLPLDWRTQIEQRLPDTASRTAALDLISAWENPHALVPGAAYLEGIEDAYSMTSAYLWGAAVGSRDDAVRAFLIKAGATALTDAREYRLMRRRRYPTRRTAA